MKDTGEMKQARDIMADLTVTEQQGNNGNESGRRRVLEEFSAWVSSVKNVNLVAKAKVLWNYLHDGRVPIANKALIVAALLYCIVPVDLVPDYAPAAGLLDDLAVVLSVLAYVEMKTTVDNNTSTHSTAATDTAKPMCEECAAGKKHGKTTL